MKPGIYKGVPFAEYKEWPGVHKGMFKHILKSGLQLKHHLDHGEEETDIMRFGNLVDCLLLEPNEFLGRYTMIPETYPVEVKKETVEKPWNWSANYCKEWRERTMSEKPDITIISQKDLDRAVTIVERIKSHPEAQKWLSGADYQVSLFWVDPETGLECKARMDVWDGKRVTDLKITEDPRPHIFKYKARRFHYHSGGAFYHDGLMHCMGIDLEPDPKIPVSFIAVEGNAPHDIVCQSLPIRSFVYGRDTYRKALKAYAEMLETGDYSGYSNVDEDLEMPEGDLRKYELEGIIES